MSLIYLIRHGETDAIGHTLVGWLPGVPINARGREQATGLVQRLAGVEFAAIYSSPLERAMQTAEPLARALGLEIRECPEVGEFHFGEWTGASISGLDSDPLWRQFNRFRSRTRAPGGELMSEVQARMVTALERIAERHPDASVAVFSHADAIRAAATHYLGMPIDFIDRIDIAPASITLLRLEPSFVQVLKLNA
ncbi:MAG: histidine phosphatase family protein [bacterium]|jgi:probable phosphomutase (TIGR03848 family)